MKTTFYKKPIFLFIILVIWGNSKAQSPIWLWAAAAGGIGDDIVTQIVVDDSNGDTYTTGYFKSTVDFDPGIDTFELSSKGEWDIFLSKLDSDGNFIWAKAMGGIDNDYGTALALDASGNVFIAGSFGGTVNFDPDGTFNITSAGGVDMFVSKFDAAGNFVWAKSMGGTEYNFINSIDVDRAGSGDIYATGRFHGTTDFDPDSTTSFNMSASDADGFILKLNDSGHFMWASSFGSTGFDFANDLIVDPTGNGDVYTTGTYRGTVDFNPDPSAVFNLTANGNQNMFMTKLDGSGHFVWAITMNGVNNNYGKSIALDPTGRYIYTTGLFNGMVDFDPGAETFNLTANGFDAFISKLDASGHFIWAKALGGPSFDIGYSIIVDPAGSGEVYTVGTYGTTADFDPGTDIFNLTSKGSDDIFISKLDDSGKFLWAKSIGGTAGDYAFGLAFDMAGHLHVAGYFISSGVSLDSVVLANTNIAGTTSDFFIAKLDVTPPSAIVDVLTNQITIYPNPVKNELTIQSDAVEFSNVRITVLNSSGAVFFSLAVKNILDNKTIDISFLPSGMYFLVVQSKDEFYQTKFIKM